MFLLSTGLDTSPLQTVVYVTKKNTNPPPVSHFQNLINLLRVIGDLIFLFVFFCKIHVLRQSESKNPRNILAKIRGDSIPSYGRSFEVGGGLLSHEGGARARGVARATSTLHNIKDHHHKN